MIGPMWILIELVDESSITEKLISVIMFAGELRVNLFFLFIKKMFEIV